MPGQNGGDVPVLAIDPKAALCRIPGQTGQTSLDAAHGEGRARPRSRGQIGEVQPDQLRGRRQGLRSPHPAPTRELGPVGGIGFQGVLRGRAAGIIAGGLDEAIECAGTGHVHGEGDFLFGHLRALELT